PSQCAKTRKIGTQNWQIENDAKVDPKKPYLCNLPSGKTIALFLYDGPISQNIAFGDTLKSGERFAARLLSAFDNRASQQLVHIATDGETYGHHQKFADMALAYCLNYVQTNKLANLTVYGQYLELFPPQFEAQINEFTSWSCAHGVERWRSDCGCHCGGGAGWNQKWRGPLRSALDFARDTMLLTFQSKGKEYFKDIWAARNAYIEVILNRAKANDFLARHGTEKALQDKPAAFKLMEMQNNALLMYTSCGWFFDEISGLESVQILAYAKRAMGYNKGLTGQDIEKPFMEKLALAISNIAAYKDGAYIYKNFVQPISIGLRKAAINYAISYLLDEILFEDRIYFYDISGQKVDVSRQDGAKLITGYGVFTNRLTTEARTVSFALLQAKGPNIMGGAIYGKTDNLEEIKEAFNFGEIEQCKNLIKGSFVDILDLKHLLKDKQMQLLSNGIEKAKKRMRANYLDLFEKERSILDYLQEFNLPMPPLFLSLVEFAINYEIKEELLKYPYDTVKIGDLINDLERVKGKLDEHSIKKILTKQLDTLTDVFAADTQDLQKAIKTADFLNFVEMFKLPINLYRAQNIVFNKIKAMAQPAKSNQIIKTLCNKLNLYID
ncbi:MAG: DUF3536 domain-containing protein, partial [Elusimicrobiota bacterium]|nr:DUF3536 domain-containing protein [Elusimicrobiota bacterium]